MIIKATSQTIKTIWIVILFIFLIFTALMGTLIHGVSIESIVLPKVKIEQLYIKLDKKIILKVDTVLIDGETKADSSIEESALLIHYFPYLNQLFSTVVIQRLFYNNETLFLSYENNLFSIKTDHLSTHFKLEPTDTYRFDILLSETFLHDYELLLDGKASVDLQNKRYSFEGNYNMMGVKGIVLLDIKNTLLTYHLQSEPFTNTELSHVMNFIAPKAEMEPLVKAWIHENIIGSSYELHFIEGKIDLKTYDYFPNEIRGRATVKDATVTFEPSVPSAHVKEIGILFEKDTLIFDIHEPSYEKKKIDKANVHIYNLIAKGTGIVVDLNATAMLDDKIHKILHAFKIDVPITQTSGNTHSHVRLDIKFLPFDINATGEFNLQPSNFLLDGIPMSASYGTVRLDNKLVYLEKANLRYKKLFDINATGVYDTRFDRFEGAMDINSLTLNFGDTSLLDMHHIEDQEAFLVIDKNGTLISLPTFETQLSFGNKANLFRFANLTLLKEVSPLMKSLDVSDGKATVFSRDFEYFDVNLSLSNLTTPFLDNNRSINDLTLSLTTDTRSLDAISADQKLALHFDTSITLHVNDLNLSIPKNDTTFDTPIPIIIHGKNSSLIMEDSSKVILSDAYTIKMQGANLQLNSKKGSNQLSVDKTSTHFLLHSDTMNDSFTDALLGNNYFYQGNFSLQMEGKSSQKNKGMFILQNTYIKELKFFNNLMATINAIPSLIVFNDPNFNQQGYFVKNGYIDFEQNGDRFLIKEMLLRGSSADIVGNGTVDFETDNIALDLQIRTLKTFSSAIDMIPLVGGLILGEDKKISTRITVTGTLDDPKVETHLVTDTLLSPFNIIKRTMELPLELFK